MSTYVPIQTISLTSNTSEINFTGIPQNFTDLYIVCYTRSTRTSDPFENMLLQFNGNASGNYSGIQMGADGSGTFSFRNSNSNQIECGRLSPSINSYIGFDPIFINVMSYSNTTTNKTVLCRSNSLNESQKVNALMGMWRQTAAITSVRIYPGQSGSQFVSGSTFTLYGIGSGSPKAFGGDEVRTDGTYWYHIFRSSGRFEPVQTLSCDYLVVAGGGGGGADFGGGGGAGGFRTASGFSVPGNTFYTVLVGAGAAGAVQSGSTTIGSNSVFSTITAAGGGGGGMGSTDYNTTNGFARDGGSGGGAGGFNSSAAADNGLGNTPSTSPSQGNNGGLGFFNGSTNAGGGGGGGAGAVGSNAVLNQAGAGGAGTASSITGTSVTYAGGGGGGGYVTGGCAAGAGGAGGGGAGGGSDSQNGFNATANTGGGGGGNAGGGLGSGGNGGSGIVIIRYSAV